MLLASWTLLAATQAPNLILIVTDDQRADALGVAGHAVLQTPHLDALAADGVRFTNAFVTTPICAASRASVLTSLSESAHGFTFGTPPVAAELARASYPARLRSAGYRTGFVGKWGMRLAPGARDELFDTFEPLRPNPYHKEQPDGSLRHLSDLTVDRAIAFVEDSDPRPFCLTVSFNAPHAEDGDPQQYFWPAALDGLYDDVEVPVPALADEEFFAAQPAFLRESLGRVRWGWRFDSEEKRQRMTRGYWRMITGVDSAVGRLRAALREHELDANTVIVFTSDNGYFLGERGFAGKWLVYEPSIRVPLLVHDPRPAAPRGVVREEMVLNLDLAPTLLALAGVEAPASWQGRSLLPLLTEGDDSTPADGVEPPLPWRNAFYFEHRFAHPQIPRSEGVRSMRWVYVRYFDQEPVHEELYDLWADPRQAHDLAGEPEAAAALEAMRARCDELAAAARR